MTRVFAALLLLLPVAPAFAQMKPCEDLKSEIAAKLDGKGIRNYQLTIVPADQVKSQTVIGSCENGTKKIVYVKTVESRKNAQGAKAR